MRCDDDNFCREPGEEDMRCDGSAACTVECSVTEPCFEGTCGGRKVRELAAGGRFGCALLVSGSVYCWGANEWGQLGNDQDVVDCNGVPCRHAPQRVPGLGNALRISAGPFNVCAILDDGTVWCWGRSELGAIGHDPFADPPCSEGKPCTRTPIQIPGLAGIVEVNLGMLAGCARDSAGDVSCWGLNKHGNVGDGTEGAEASAKLTPVPSQATGVRISLAGVFDLHGCAIDGGGNVSCWGHNNYGGTGHAPATGTDVASCSSGYPCTPTPAQVQGAGAGDLAAVGSTTCAVNGIGETQCWGLCDSGITGMAPCTARGDGNSYLIPPALLTGVPSPGGFVALAGRDSHMCGVQGAGNRSIWCWGQGGHGQLANLDFSSCTAGGQCSRVPQDTGLDGIPFPGTGPFTLAVDTESSAWGWGSNDFGQAGHPPGTAGDTECGGNACNATPVLVEGLP